MLGCEDTMAVDNEESNIQQHVFSTFEDLVNAMYIRMMLRPLWLNVLILIILYIL